jgi:hypothetical protein
VIVWKVTSDVILRFRVLTVAAAIVVVEGVVEGFMLAVDMMSLLFMTMLSMFGIMDLVIFC